MTVCGGAIEIRENQTANKFLRTFQDFAASIAGRVTRLGGIKQTHTKYNFVLFYIIGSGQRALEILSRSSWRCLAHDYDVISAQT